MNNINIIKSEKFKTITIKVVFYNEFTENNATSLSLLSRLLVNTTKKYNTKKKIINKLCELYDASIYVSSSPSYKTSITSFILSIVNEKFVNDDRLIDRGIDFLYELITNPNVINNSFDINVFNEEKRILKDEIEKIYNNKNRYALRQAIKNMCPGEVVSISSLGTIEELEKITPESIYETYLDLINNSKVDIYAMGDIDYTFKNKLKKFKKIKSNNRELEPVEVETIIPNEVKKILEKQDVNQAKLVMGFRTGCTYKEDEYYSLQLFSLMFGGLFTSNLFQTIREEHSLCYEIASQLIPDSKLMIVNCGIDSNNIDEVVNLVMEELSKYQKGKIDLTLLETAKKNAISDMDEIEDGPNAYISFLMKQDLLKQNYSIEDIKNIVMNISASDIQTQAQNIKLDTVFCLTNK